MMSDYNVEMTNDGFNEFNVEFHGPKESIARLSPLSNMHFIVVDRNSNYSFVRVYEHYLDCKWTI